MDKEVLKLIQVAKLYYEENLNQSQIGKKLGVSRPLISNMLTKARNMGIVEIKIKEPYANNSLLLNQLKNIYNIQGGFVIPSSKSSYLTEKNIINQSVAYLEDIYGEVKNIGLGWGYTMSTIVDAISEKEMTKKFEGSVCSLIGTATIQNKGYHPSELIRQFGSATGFNPEFLFAPAFPSTEQEKELYINTENYRAIEHMWDNLDVSVVTIGAYPSVPDHATAMRFGNKLNEQRAVGKILSYFYDKNGQIIKSHEDYALQIPINKLAKVKKVIGICPSEINAKAILGALKTGFITHIILTEERAREVIELRSL